MAEIDDMIGALRALGRGDFAAEIAKEAAPGIEAALRQTAGAGMTPEGQAWPARKDGGPPMPHAAAHVRAQAIGPVVRVTLSGPDVFHHLSKKSSEPRRRVIPDVGGETPAPVARALEQAAADVFARVLGGGAR